MIIRIKEINPDSIRPIRKWLMYRGIYERDDEYQFEYYGYEYNDTGDLEFYPIIHFKRDNLLSGPELTEFTLRFGG